MGIWGLTSYVNAIDNFWEEIDLRNKKKVIIDANSLLYHLYFNFEVDCRHGGQYKEFHDEIVSFFKYLEEHKVEPYVLLDGAPHPSDKKLNTLKERATDKITRNLALAKDVSPKYPNFLPLLARQSFIQIMQGLSGVRFAVCDFEADQEIASLAAKWECPVISTDSDFFIFDLRGGYIPLEYLDWRSGQPKAKLFRVDKLSEYLKIQKELLPLVASLLGNDFVKFDVLEPLYIALGISECTVKEKISEICKHFQSLQEGDEAVLQLVTGQSPGESELRQDLKSSINSYKVHDSQLAVYFENGQVNSRLESRKAVPFAEAWALTKFRQGSFPIMCMEAFTVGRLFFHPQVEDVNAAPADQCSIELRKFAYGVLRNGDATVITEWKREGKKLREYTVQPSHYLHGFGELPSLSNIPDLGDAERRKLCLSLLESHTDRILSLPAQSRLFAASVRYWIKHAQPKIRESHLRALLVCSLLLAEGEHHHDEIPRKFDLTAQQSFAQWQCVMQEAVNVNQILQEPLPTPSIQNLYDGLLVHSLVLDSSEVSEITLETAQSLYNAITDGISGRLLPSIPGSLTCRSTSRSGDEGNTEREQKTSSRSLKKKEYYYSLPTSNRFDILAVEDKSSTKEENDLN